MEIAIDILARARLLQSVPTNGIMVRVQQRTTALLPSVLSVEVPTQFVAGQ
ncbi:hypothetical protein HSRCO_1268 [Halanaeroarchaeum sp. HSR-CO]|nr:hypothetical protein HSRCO_1268 [Halanaeroarchaeum sp. HSR-CO]